MYSWFHISVGIQKPNDDQIILELPVGSSMISNFSFSSLNDVVLKSKAVNTGYLLD